MRSNKHLVSIALTMVMLLSGTAVHAQDPELRAMLFGEADAAMEVAVSEQAKVLAPKAFARATKYYEGAEKRLKRDGSLERVRRSLSEAVESFEEATKLARVAQVTFASLIKTRAAAEKAEAGRLAPTLWKQAEDNYKLAAAQLEFGNMRTAKKTGSLAETQFRDAELNAIKASYLGEIRDLLQRAKKEKVKRYAPRTLARAESLADQAEQELENNRYDADLPRSLAQEAVYEARHAIYLAVYVRRARDADQTIEDVVLEWERPIISIAAAADLVALLDKGYEAPADEIATYIEALRKENYELQQEVSEQGQRILGLEDEITELDQRLGGAREERIILAQRLAAQERIKEQVRQVDQMFTRQEALVFREGNEILIRLVGLNFAVGRAEIEARNTPLLDKVQRAIRVFPRAELSIEGHTDSHGSDEANLQLSQQRADAVRHYLLTVMRLPADRVSATGFGETRPVANNESKEGRAKNRRIDIRIKPDMEIT